MPTLDFKGKSFVYTHHLSVPFRELVVDAKKSLPAKGAKPSLDDNLIIHGDNLHALKALLPMVAGKVDCIFIDPPYNTGNEGWCYNDNVRGPLIQQWIQDEANPVDKEDLERHDKWLCMMWPRLQLLHELLSEDGAIFVTLDDNEMHRFRSLLDEIFGIEGFYATIVWQKKYTASNDHQGISPMHDYVIAYRKSETFQRNLLERDEGRDSQYKYEDEKGVYRLSDYTCGKTAEERPSLYYEIENPHSGAKVLPKTTRVWAYSEAEHQKNVDGGFVAWGADESASVPSFKRYKHLLRGGGGTVPATWWDWQIGGHTDEAKKELNSIFSSDANQSFVTPKPLKLIELILQIATNENSIILDSFAGSGTTAHAVLAANKKDGGNRKFILVEMEDYADKLTAERVRRVIDGYSFKGTQREELHRENVTWTKLKKASELVEQVEKLKMLEGDNFDKITPKVDGGQFTITGEKKITEKVDGLGGSFTFASLGQEMTLDKLLGGAGDDGEMPTYESLAKYVFYTATGRTLDKLPAQAKRAHGFIGEIETYRVHLIYQPDAKWLASNDAALTETLVDTLVDKNPDKSKRLLVFAPAKFMSQKELTRRGIDFCQLPYAIHRILGA